MELWKKIMIMVHPSSFNLKQKQQRKHMLRQGKH
jgi:hypothetical protein